MSTVNDYSFTVVDTMLDIPVLVRPCMVRSQHLDKADRMTLMSAPCSIRNTGTVTVPDDGGVLSTLQQRPATTCGRSVSPTYSLNHCIFVFGAMLGDTT